MNINSTAGKFSVLRQLCNRIPGQVLPKLVREHNSERHARDFSHWSQVVALLSSKINHSFGLNDLCDQLEIHSGSLAAIRGATPARRNTLSHAGKVRPAAIAEGLFWGTLKHLGEQSPDFGRRKFPGRLKKLNRTISLMDSTVIERVANCMGWASHHRNKAAAKCPLRLDFESLLPRYAYIGTARGADASRAGDLTAGLKMGGLGIFYGADSLHSCGEPFGKARHFRAITALWDSQRQFPQSGDTSADVYSVFYRNPELARVLDTQIGIWGRCDLQMRGPGRLENQHYRRDTVLLPVPRGLPVICSAGRKGGAFLALNQVGRDLEFSPRCGRCRSRCG